MRRCRQDEADIAIDGVYWRLESLAEMRRLEHLRGRRGVRFFNFMRSESRLAGERKRDRKGTAGGESHGRTWL